ncbi:MAG: TlpA family protein disulfide reductase [Thermoguttaceae bacterium]|nr:TlpA family protein disulfide reductase [Thermoguttaceae bacterium]
MIFQTACVIPPFSRKESARNALPGCRVVFVLLFLISLTVWGSGCTSPEEGENGESAQTASSVPPGASGTQEFLGAESPSSDRQTNAWQNDGGGNRTESEDGGDSQNAFGESVSEGAEVPAVPADPGLSGFSGNVPHIEESVKAPEGNGLLGVKGGVSVRSILEQMVQAYREARTYRDQGEIRISWTQNGNPHERRVMYRTSFQRPNRLFLEVDQTGILADGETFCAYTSEMPGLLLQRSCPKELGILDILCERELYWAVTDVESSQFSYLPPPLVLLLSTDPLATFLHEAEQGRLSHLAEEFWEGRRCFRISVLRDESEQTIFWIDAESFLLRRVELPRQILKNENSSGNEEMVVTLDFNGAELNWTGLLEMGVPANSVVVSSFTQPQMELLGTEFPDFQFTLLRKGEAAPSGDGNVPPETPDRVQPGTVSLPEMPEPAVSRIPQENAGRLPQESLSKVQSVPLTKKSFAGKTVFLFFWSIYETNVFNFQDMERLFQEIRTMPNVSFLGVNIDAPEMSAEKILAAAESFGLTCPIAKDASGQIAQMLRNGEMFSCFLLDTQGRVQFCDTLGTFYSGRAYSDLVLRVSSGEEIFQERILELKRAESDYQETIRLWVENGIFLKETETEKIEIAEPRIEPASEPVACRKKELWRSETLYSPTWILPEPERKRILVLENGNSVAILDPAGTLIERKVLDVPQDEFLESLRSVEHESGTIYAAAGKRIFLFDGSWKQVGVYPPMEAENGNSSEDGAGKSEKLPQGTVSDLLAGDWDQDGKPEIYAAFWEEESFLKLSLAGEVLAVGEGVSNVFQIAGTTISGMPELWIVDQSGAVSVFDPRDLRVKSVLSVAQRTLGSLKVHDFDADGKDEMAGIALGVRVKFKAVGVTQDGKELWNLDLPNFAYQRKIEKILPVCMNSESEIRSGWLVIGPDSSLHFVESTGMLIDQFHFGQIITGAASCILDGTPCLLLSTPDGVTALEISR